MSPKTICGCGGTGRPTCLKSRRVYAHAGSSPATRTKPRTPMVGSQTVTLVLDGVKGSIPFFGTNTRAALLVCLLQSKPFMVALVLLSGCREIGKPTRFRPWRPERALQVRILPSVPEAVDARKAPDGKRVCGVLTERRPGWPPSRRDVTGNRLPAAYGSVADYPETLGCDSRQERMASALGQRHSGYGIRP